MSSLHKALLVTHAVAAGVLVGASTHLALQALSAIRRKAHPRLLRLYPKVALAAWGVTFALGAWMYPRYRIAVRQDYLEAHAPWAAALFDVKENLAVLVGPLLFAAWLMAREVPTEDDPALVRWFAAVCATACALSWWNLLSGLLVVSVRSV